MGIEFSIRIHNAPLGHSDLPPALNHLTFSSKQHLESIELACPIADLGFEIPRQSAEVRRAAALRIKRMLDLGGSVVLRLAAICCA